MFSSIFVRSAVLACAAVLTFMTVSVIEPGQASSVAETNPLTQNWEGPYGGTPPFDKVKVADFKPALEAAMAENLAEVEKIATDPAAPTFDNTIAAMEKTGTTLDRVTTIYGIWGSNLSTPEYQAVEEEMDPKIAAFNDKITQKEALFKRIETVYNSPAKAKLTAEQQRLTWRYYTNFVRQGAKLDARTEDGLTPLDYAMGRAPNTGRGAGPFGGGGQGGPGGPRGGGPQLQAAALLRQLMGLPADERAEAPR